MPDLQSELNKLLTQQQFDDDADRQPAKEPASARERAWHFIKANPGATVGEIATAVGMSASGIAGGLHKMVARGDLRRTRADDGTGFRYHTASDAYVVMSLEDRVASMQKARAEMAKKRKSAAKKPKAASTPKSEPAVTQQFDADAILVNLNVLQARELMDKLRKLFGG